MLWLQQNPIVVEVAKQPPPTRDVSIDVVLGIFALAGVFLLAAPSAARSSPAGWSSTSAGAAMREGDSHAYRSCGSDVSLRRV